MKKIFILFILTLSLLLRFATSVRIAPIHQNEIYKMKITLIESVADISKINNKFPMQKFHTKLSYKENGKYEGYFLVKTYKKYENYDFIELEEIKSQKIEDNFLEKYVNKIFERSQKNFSYALKNMNRAILLGDNSGISKKLNEKIRYIGLSHIFAMSGLHIGLIFSIFYFIFFKILKSKRQIEIGSLIFISIYYFAVKESPSFTRAYIMILIFILGKIFYEKTNIKKSLFLSVIISIFIKPTVIFSLSFQLSYLAVIAIIYIYPELQRINIKKWKILDFLILSISVQLFLCPILIYYFSVVPFSAIILNTFLIPIATVYISLSFVALFLENFYLSFLLSPFIKLIHKLFIHLIEFFSKFPKMSVEFYRENILFIYLGIFVIILLKRYWSKFYEDNKKRSKNRIRRKKI